MNSPPPFFSNAVVKDFEQFATIRGQTLVFPPDVALKIINKCKELNVKILGIDGFFLSPEGNRPSMEDSIDFSNFKGNIYEEAKVHISSRMKEPIHFEIVLDLKYERSS